jgi:hypothetical protein
MFDVINKPAHYNIGASKMTRPILLAFGLHESWLDCECIDVVEDLGFCLGNAIKYLWRCGQKGDPVEDLKKAKWYFQRVLKRGYRENKNWLNILFRGTVDVAPIETAVQMIDKLLEEMINDS